MYRIILFLSIVWFSGATFKCKAFSLIGPYEAWQTVELGYDATTFDIGGPMNLGEEYRWNIRQITYAFDPSFVTYFGTRGVAEVKKAIAMLNGLPPFSRIKLQNYPLNAMEVNQQARVLRVLDLKSSTIGSLLEEFGLHSPERFVWTLRDRVPIDNGQQYTVVMRNFDPVSHLPSRYVNGNLFTYIVLDPVPGFDTDFADAVEIPVDPLGGETAVASAANGRMLQGFITGGFYRGLTRDDVGGLRYIYAKNNYNVEGLLPETIVSGAGMPWTPVVGATNGVDLALRPGIDKIVLKQIKIDSVFGIYVPFTNSYTDMYVTNSRTLKQRTRRFLQTPDIVFAASDLGNVEGIPSPYVRTDLGNWINNAGTNSLGGPSALTGGPGVIAPPVFIAFNKVGPYQVNDYDTSSGTYSLSEETASRGFVWGAFDGTTNAPFVFPVDASGRSFPLRELENIIFSRP